ncbi:MAG: hypothetical protein A2583_14345 [Bdellovibrionales bacterium RIFOXYD1_FULL_53_11]|nr:MAG: hypothetical protein A2583_14345 [Bdellovibrionales bacterium RIFOXYD1_FULL_53_11]
MMMPIMPTLLFVYVCAGVFGWGFFLWKAVCALDKNKTCYPGTFAVSVAWFAGYAFVEAFLSLLATVRLFSPAPLLVLVVLFLSYGVWQALSGFRLQWKKHNAGDYAAFAFLLFSCGFVLFWNIYPTIDVDSLATYYYSIKKMLDAGGFFYSRYDDVRLYNPLGDNLLYAPGLIFKEGGLVFAQLLHAVSKVFLLLLGYGAAVYFGLRRGALLVPLLIYSEEHLLASGANFFVRINTLLVAGIGLWAFGLAIWLREKRESGAWLAAFGALAGISCKLFAIPLLSVAALIVMATGGMPLFRNFKFLALFVPFIFGSSVCYFRSLILAGSPFYPATFGPFTSTYYDDAVQLMGRLAHFNLTPRQALINFSIFSAWTRILPLKWLAGLCFANGLLLILRRKRTDQILEMGFAFALCAILFVLYQEIFIVYEMRYYRFPILIQAIAFSFLAVSMLGQLEAIIADNLKASWTRSACVGFKTAVSWALLACFAAYCVSYSFNVMYDSRAQAHEVTGLISGAYKEREAVYRHHRDKMDLFKAVDAAGLNTSRLGYFTAFNWPKYLCPLKGVRLNLMQTGTMPSETYFDAGLFAAELLGLGIGHVLHYQIDPYSYPLGGTEVGKVLLKCGKNSAVIQQIIMLDEKCLAAFAAKKDIVMARERLKKLLNELRSRPPYEPFLPPEYGHIHGV